MSLAIARSTNSSAIALAGINSSSADQDAGKNEHLRSFELHYPKRRKAETEIAERENSREESTSKTVALGRASLFTPSTATKKETYQRVLRLFPANAVGEKTLGDRTLGVIASSLGLQNEIVVFDVAQNRPSTHNVRRRLKMETGQEAADIDIIAEHGQDYLLAYCTDYEVYITKAMSSTEAAEEEPILVYQTPHPDAFASTKARPKFRSLRFLQPNLLLLVQNKVNRGGAELIVLGVPSPLSLATIILRKSLQSFMKAATALSVCDLPASISENAQNIIAVAGQDNSITILSLDHPQQKPIPSLKFRTHTILRDAHSQIITSVTFASFSNPPDPATASPQYIKLASTSIAGSIVVHTFPLTPYPSPSRNRQPSRYVLTSPGSSESAQATFSVVISALMIALGAFFLQAFTEIRGGTPEYLGAKGWLPERVHGWIARPYMFDDAVPTANLEGVAAPSLELQNSVARAAGSAKEEIENVRIPGVDDLNVPGVEPNPAEGVKSVAAEVSGTVGEKVQQAKQVVQDAGETVKGSLKEATEEVSQRTENAQEKLGLRHLLSRRPSSNSAESVSSKDSPSDIIVQHDENSKALSADIRDANTVIGDAHRKWEDLEAHERETWKRRLIDAGEWAVEEGEAVLKGVFFQNIALAVGEAVGHGVGG